LRVVSFAHVRIVIELGCLLAMALAESQRPVRVIVWDRSSQKNRREARLGGAFPNSRDRTQTVRAPSLVRLGTTSAALGAGGEADAIRHRRKGAIDAIVNAARFAETRRLRSVQPRGAIEDDQVVAWLS
jgi:hypothetical protein